MSAYVPTSAIEPVLEGRETDVLDRLGIPWREGRPHIRCPYPTHGGEGDWRWDEKKRRAYCTCSKGDNIFGVVGRCQGVEFEEAKIRVAELLGRSDIIRQKAAKGPFIKHNAEGLLAATATLQEDSLVAAYLGHRLGIAPEAVLLPSTRALGLKALGYYDPPPTNRHKAVHVGDYPCLVFET
ncbi:MAG: hypothetical protein K2X62_11485, partial [Beijerinckiaceae bacterium]|nr:hypothetical protein [Beijerinckiaceae bacterium]MBX9758001.1 hypothetical protein [Beijerinckiaceae bacterium]